jgi:hypothetical protein
LRQQCDRVEYSHIFPSFPQVRRDMQRAADIRGDQRARLAWRGAFQYLIKQRIRHYGVSRHNYRLLRNNALLWVIQKS